MSTAPVCPWPVDHAPSKVEYEAWRSENPAAPEPPTFDPAKVRIVVGGFEVQPLSNTYEFDE